MSADLYCGVCQGAGWDWRRAADEDLQVDDPVDYYECPCVEVMRLRADLAAANSELRSDLLAARQEITRLRAAGDALAEVADEWPELVEAWQEARRER